MNKSIFFIYFLLKGSVYTLNKKTKYLKKRNLTNKWWDILEYVYIFAPFLALFR